MDHQRTGRLIDKTRKWCADTGTKQAHLARILDVTPQLVNSWFKGQKRPGGDLALHLQELLKKGRQAGGREL